MLPTGTAFDKVFLSDDDALEEEELIRQNGWDLFLCSRGAKSSDSKIALQAKLYLSGALQACKIK